MNAKIIIIVGIVSFIAGGIFTAGGIYIYEKNRLSELETKYIEIEKYKLELTDRIRDYEQLNTELETSITKIGKLNDKTGSIYTDIEKIFDIYDKSK